MITGLQPFELYSQKTKARSKTTQPELSLKSASSSVENTVIATVGKENITYADLEKAFKKNMNRKEAYLYLVSRDSLKDFLTLYTNYRLKVIDAIGRGFDKDSAVLADISQNRRILAESYFYEKRLVEPKVDQILKLRERELQFAFMLFKFPPLPGNDTTATYRKAMASLELVKNGKDFAVVARDSSEEKESALRGGLVQNYVTGGRLQRSIENALYSVKAGEVYPELVRFREGYLVLKLMKNEPRDMVKARHILLSEGLDKDSAKVIKKADSLIALLKQGKDFTKLAEENSEDPGTAMRGGDVGGWYSRSSGLDSSSKTLPINFVDALFALKDGEFSGKVYTDYGIHIIKREATKKINLSAEKEEVKKLYKRIYYEQDKKSFLDSLRNLYGYKLNSNGLRKFISALDTNKTTLDTAWTKNISNSISNELLYTFNKKQVKVGDYVKILKTKAELRGTSTNEDGIKKSIEKYLDPQSFEMATKDIDNEFPDFAQLMKEFKDGILLFRVEALEVWDKLKFDSTLARVYWDSTKHRYYTQPTYEFSEIYVLNDTIANEIYKKAIGGEDFEKLAEGNTQRSGYREKKGYWGKVSTKDNQLVKLFHEKKPNPPVILEPIKYEKGWSVVKVTKFEPTRQKTFEEAISDFAPDFQDLMQKALIEKWLKAVKQKYTVSINNDSLNKVIEELKNRK